MKRQIRMDVGRLGRSERTPQGFLRVAGNATRIGVLTYRRRDGSEFRELRHPSEVFNADSLKSLAFAPLTDRHPAELVSPRNVRDLQVGIVTDVRADGRFVAGDLIVQDQRMIEKIERGDARELSAGYTCQVDETPGDFNGERYDGVQRAIIYNHLAIGPRDWGRAGGDVSIHVDGASEELLAMLGVEHLDDAGRKIVFDLGRRDPVDRNPNPREGSDTMELRTIRIDGVDVKVDPATAQFVERALSERDAKITAAEKRADEAAGKVDAVTKERDELKTKLDSAADPAKIAAAVKARVGLEASARKILGPEVKLDGKTDQEIKVDVLRKSDENFDPEGRTDAYVDGRFDAVVAAAPDRNDGVERVRRAVADSRGAPTTNDRRDDADEPRVDSADAAKRNMVDRAAQLGTKPLRVSVGD